MDKESYKYYRFFRSKLWKRLFIVVAITHMLLILFEPPYAGVYDREEEQGYTVHHLLEKQKEQDVQDEKE